MTATVEEMFYVTYRSRRDGELLDTVVLDAEGLVNTIPVPLHIVIETCEELNLDADLTDSKGNKRGWVHSTGRYSVGDGQ